MIDILLARKRASLFSLNTTNQIHPRMSHDKVINEGRAGYRNVIWFETQNWLEVLLSDVRGQSVVEVRVRDQDLLRATEKREHCNSLKTKKHSTLKKLVISDKKNSKNPVKIQNYKKNFNMNNFLLLGDGDTFCFMNGLQDCLCTVTKVT